MDAAPRGDNGHSPEQFISTLPAGLGLPSATQMG